jgi:dihydrofolate synthase/folylpolyglutamate synthase
MDSFFKSNNVKMPQLVTSNLVGMHQIRNIKTAIFAAFLLAAEQITITNQSIIDGISNVRKNTGLHYRIELVNNDPQIILDVAHNPSSIQALVDTLKLIDINKK